MFLDIAVGILLAIGASEIFAEPLTSWVVVWGIAFALLPDIDAMVELELHGSIGGKEVREHRNLTHYPILYPIPVVVVGMTYGWKWATLLALGVLWHFLHDSVHMGYGTKLLWPFSKRSYKFFARKEDGGWAWQFVTSWEPDELEEVVREHGDPDWVRNYYLRASPTLLTELGSLAFALVVLLLVW